MNDAIKLEPASAPRRFKRFPAYKDSGVEWLGGIPADWEMSRLKFRLAAPLKYGANEAAELDDPDPPRYVRITDIDEHAFHSAAVSMICSDSWHMYRTAAAPSDGSSQRPW